MLEELFYGHIQPCDMNGRRDPRIQPLMQKLTDAEVTLRARKSWTPLPTPTST